MAISIHAPTWGATVDGKKIDIAPVFQSTLPRGERPFTEFLTGDYTPISIHAPTWGATVGQYITSYAPRNFNPRSHVGSDSAAHPRSHCNKVFQSTLPRGERHILHAWYMS